MRFQAKVVLKAPFQQPLFSFPTSLTSAFEMLNFAAKSNVNSSIWKARVMLGDCYVNAGLKK